MALFDWIGPAISIASSVLGGNETASGNEAGAAASTVGRDKAVAALTAGADRARAVVNPQLAQAQKVFGTGVDYLGRVVARDPNILTPQQEIDLADRRRITLRGINPGLRGSGRFTTAALNDITNRGKAGMIAANTARADAGANTLTSTGGTMQTGAVNTLANLESGQGKDIANVETGNATNQGNAAVATGNVNSSTIGDIGSFFADAIKGDRNSRYNEYRAAAA